MMYSNHFVMCVVQDGQPVKELGNGVVKLPFGSEYSLRFRNKNNRRAVVQIFIDGENVSGGGYVIPANDFIDIKRHHDVDRSFKFVSLDSADAQDFGKDGPNHDKVKGTIEARFKLEKERPVAPVVIDHHHHHHHDHYHPRPKPWYPIYPDPYRWLSSGDSVNYGSTCKGGPSGSSAGGSNAGADYSGSLGFAGGVMHDSAPMASLQNLNSTKSLNSKRSLRMKTCSTEPTQDNLSLNESMPLQDGCTVEGTSTGQNFSTVYIDLEDVETVLKLFLQGFEDHEVSVANSKPKSKRVSALEEENERLRQELENIRLKEELKKTNVKKPRKSRKKAVK